MRLALALHRTHAELLDTMSSAELTRWIAFDHIEGLPTRRLEIATALAGAVVANSHPRKEAVDPNDLIPDLRPRQPKTYDQWCVEFGAWAKGHNKRAQNKP